MQKAFAFGNYVINDGESFIDSTITTILEEGIGLPPAKASLAGRTGAWPLFSGMNRSRGRKLTMESHFTESSAADRASKRRYLSAALNPELEETSRLIVADSIAPKDFVDGFGPWGLNIDGTTIEIRSILRDMIATVTGPLYFEDGPEDRQRAMGILNATVNLATNPSVEANATNWSVTANATGTRDLTESKYGGYSYKVVTDGVAAGEGSVYTQSGLTATTEYTFSVWVKAPLAAVMELEIDDTTDTTTQAFTGTGEWQRVHVAHTMAAGETVATITVQTKTSAQEITIYVDALQVEASDFPTIYCDGDQHGSVWSGTVHASTSNRGNTQFNLDAEVEHISNVSALTFRFKVKMPLDANADWPDGNQYIMYAYNSVSEAIDLEFDRADDRFRVVYNGGTVLTSPLQTFSKGDWLDIVFTLDTVNSLHALYIDSTAVDTDTTAKSPTAFVEWNLGSSYDGTAQADWIFSEFDVWDRALTATEVASIVSEGTVAGRARWLDAFCEQANVLNVRGKPTDRGMISRLIASGDVRWQSGDGDFWSFLMSDDQDTMSIVVDSDDDVYPIIRIEPQTTKTGGFAYKVFQAVHWQAPQGYYFFKYPTQIRAGWDTGALTTAKMQADGDDLRVYVDGVEVDRWLVDMDTASTDVWINLNWKPAIPFTLAHDIGAGEAATTLTMNESVSKMPSQGILMINSEYFVYSGKINAEKQFTGVVRASHGSIAAGHSTDDDVLWLQHEIYIVYGNSTLAAPDVDDEYKPMFVLGSSTNDSWVYTHFGDGDYNRTGLWLKQAIRVQFNQDELEFYTDSDYTDSDPYDAIGIYALAPMVKGRWFLYNPCGITNANFTGGRKKNTTSGIWASVIKSSIDAYWWPIEYEIPEPAATGGWENWSRNEALTAGSVYVALQIGIGFDIDTGWVYVTGTLVDADGCTITLDTTYTPNVTDGAEQDNYELVATIANVTTGESILVELQMAEDEILELDSLNKTITYLEDGSRQMQTLTLVEGARRDWLRLVPGLNQLTWSDTGTTRVELNIYFARRYFE